MISIIVAVGKNNVIGKNNALIWHLPADMKFFKEKTSGHCIITGRKNYESIPAKFRPLPNRTNIIITRQENYDAPGAIVVNSIEKAIEKATDKGDSEIFIIGGAEIYSQSLRYVNRIYITQIDHYFENADVFFPEIKSGNWTETSRIKGITDEKNIYSFDFVILDKKD